MEERLLGRAKTSGRVDDNAESIKKRFQTFMDATMPIIEYYESKGLVRRVSAVPSPEQVFEEVKRVFAQG